MNVSIKNDINNYPLKMPQNGMNKGQAFGSGRLEQKAEAIANKLVSSKKVQNFLKNTTFNKKTTK